MKIAQKFVSAVDPVRTIKYLQETEDGFLIETSYIDYPNKHIICFSSQIGCVVGCVFCAVGIFSQKTQFKRSLSEKEIFLQCTNVIDDLGITDTHKPVLFSCMGMGEPFLNFRNVVNAMQSMGLLFKNSRLAISTSGIRPDYIRALGNISFPAPLKLQISLHAPDDELRRSIISNTEPLAEVVAAARDYQRESRRPLEWNYVLIGGVNDSVECACGVVQLLGPGQHVKFNVLNPVKGCSLEPSSLETLCVFRMILEESGLTTEHYFTNGQDVGAACGQLAFSSKIQNPTG